MSMREDKTRDDDSADVGTVLHAAGYKIVIGPPGSDPPRPKSWGEVPARINNALMSLAVGLFELAEGIVTSATRLVRGVGNLPAAAGSALQAKAARQMEAADYRESRRQVESQNIDPEVAAKRLSQFLQRKQVQGYRVIVTTHEGVAVVAIVPPLADEDVLEVIRESVRELPAAEK